MYSTGLFSFCIRSLSFCIRSLFRITFVNTCRSFWPEALLWPLTRVTWRRIHALTRVTLPLTLPHQVALEFRF